MRDGRIGLTLAAVSEHSRMTCEIVTVLSQSAVALNDREDSVLVLIDHQPYQFANLHSHEPTMIVNNVIGLAKTAKVFNVPTILTTVLEERGGYLIKGLQDVFPDQKPIDRIFIRRAVPEWRCASWRSWPWRRANASRPRNPDHVTGPNSSIGPLQRCARPLPGRHDKGLAQRMGVPRGPGSGLERDTRAGHTRRIGRLEERVDAHRAGEILASISIPSATGHSLQVFRVPSP
jgi:hypothetical protein